MNKLIVLGAFAALAAVAPAGAAPIGTLYNTGVDSSGVATTGNSADLHWTLAGGTAYTGATNGSFPIPPWVPETATSRWITPTANAGSFPFDFTSDGIYTFSQSFSLTGFQFKTASLSGVFASDNTVDSITLNGKTITGSGGSFTSFLPFSSTAGAFQAGTNTLTFTVRNFAYPAGGSNPTGLRVEVAGTAAVVPEPATWAMLVVGFGLVGAATRRRVRTVAA